MNLLEQIFPVVDKSVFLMGCRDVALTLTCCSSGAHEDTPTSWA